jgi:PEP-CTERM motif
MRRSGLLGAAVALSVLAPIVSAHAIEISAGDLMYTDLYKWQGQYGTPTWREILANFDCTAELTFYLWNVPAPSPLVATPSGADPIFPASTPTSSVGPVDRSDPRGPIGTPNPGGDATTTLVDPPGIPGGDAPSPATAVPEPSTWALLLLGFAGLAYAAMRRGRAPRDSVLQKERTAGLS